MSRPTASISASTPCSADLSRKLVSVVCAPHCCVAMAGNADKGGRHFHDVMVTDWQVTQHYRDPVTAGLRWAAGRQQP
jgi:hypothetical protein